MTSNMMIEAAGSLDTMLSLLLTYSMEQSPS